MLIYLIFFNNLEKQLKGTEKGTEFPYSDMQKEEFSRILKGT